LATAAVERLTGLTSSCHSTNSLRALIRYHIITSTYPIPRHGYTGQKVLVDFNALSAYMQAVATLCSESAFHSAN